MARSTSGSTRLMRGGDDWNPEIERKLRECDVFVLLVSRHSTSSDYVVDKEIAIIRERQKNREDVHFYPLLLTPTADAGLDIVRDKNMRPRFGEAVLNLSAQATAISTWRTPPTRSRRSRRRSPPAKARRRRSPQPTPSPPEPAVSSPESPPLAAARALAAAARPENDRPRGSAGGARHGDPRRGPAHRRAGRARHGQDDARARGGP